MKRLLALLALTAVSGFFVAVFATGAESHNKVVTVTATVVSTVTTTVISTVTETVTVTEPPPPSERFQTSATDAFVSTDTGQPEVLNGLNLQPIYSGGLTGSAQLAQLQSMRARGFTAARFFLFWNLMEPTQGNFQHLAALDQAIMNAELAGVHVILEMIDGINGSSGCGHIPSWVPCTDSLQAIQQYGKPYVRMLADRYSDTQAVVAYDPVNEPSRWPLNQTAALQMYQDLLTEIRAVDPDKIVTIEPIFGNTNIGPACADWSVLTHRSNVVLHFHDYFSHGDDDGFSGCATVGSYTWQAGYAGYPGTNHSARVDAIKAMPPAGIPVMVGEYGIQEGAPGHDQFITDKKAAYGGVSRLWWEHRCNCGWSATNSDYTWKAWIGLLF